MHRAQDTQQPADPFFSRPETQAAIAYLSHEERLTLVIGAGASADAGIPTWEILVRSLLLVLPELQDPSLGSDPTDTAEYIISDQGLPAAAAMVEASLGRRRLLQEIRRLLYDNSPTPGRFARAVMEVALVCDLCKVLTTNYDDLLVRAGNAYPGVRFMPAVDPRTARDPEIKPVWHLHGFIPQEFGAGDAQIPEIIFTERDYLPSGQWQEDFVKECLENSVCLFLGTSLRDPNLIQYLYLANKYLDRSTQNTPRHYVTFVRRIPGRESSVSIDLEASLDSVYLRRWRQLGLEPVTADYPSQVPQLLFEVILRKVLGPASYDSEYRNELRVARWREALDRQMTPNFSATQQSLYGELHGCAEGIRALLPAYQRGTPEHLAVELWVRNPRSSPRRLERLSVSTHPLQDRELVETVAIASPSGSDVVDAYLMGNVGLVELTEHALPWRHRRSVPVYLEDPPWYRLPVGVITLTSTGHPDRNAFTLARPQDLSGVDEVLSATAQRLLTPAPTQ